MSDPKPLTPDLEEILQAIHRADCTESTARAMYMLRDGLEQAWAETDRCLEVIRGLEAENEYLRGVLLEIGKASHIDWPDDVVNDPKEWIAGILEKP